MNEKHVNSHYEYNGKKNIVGRWKCWERTTFTKLWFLCYVTTSMNIYNIINTVILSSIAYRRMLAPALLLLTQKHTFGASTSMQDDSFLLWFSSGLGAAAYSRNAELSWAELVVAGCTAAASRSRNAHRLIDTHAALWTHTYAWMCASQQTA